MKFIYLIYILLLSGCATLQNRAGLPQSNNKADDRANGLLVNNDQFQNKMANFKQPEKNINFYVQKIMHGLIDNIQYVNSQTPLAVTSFVNLDSQYEKSSLLGNQMAESFIHEVHNFGIPVIDFKTTDEIEITSEGDFSLSRNFSKLKSNNSIEYILTGTLVKQVSGYLVNARIIGIKSKVVVASSQGFIPHAVINLMLPSKAPEKNRDSLTIDGIPITLNR